MRCPKCGGYSWNRGENCEVCTGCGYMTSAKPEFELLGKVDIFKLAKLLKGKQEAKEKDSARLTNSQPKQ